MKLADLIGDLTGGTKYKRIYRLVETLYVVVWRSIDLHLSSKPWVGLCLDLLRAKSEGLVPMEIPLGLIPRTPYDERRVGVA